MKYNTEIILKALLNGNRIKLPSYGDTELELFDNGLFMIAHDQDGKEFPLIANMPLIHFIKECEKMSFDDCFLTNANNVLNDIKRRK